MRGKFNYPRLVIAALAVLVAATCVASCSTPHKEIDAIGVVAAEHEAYESGTTVDSYTFDDGRTFELRYAGTVAVRGPEIGDLIIAGSKPSNWMLIAPLRVPDSSWHVPCYGLVENGDERDTTVELDFGATLQKASDFEEGGRNPKNSTRITGGVICLNRDGQVRRIF